MEKRDTQEKKAAADQQAMAAVRDEPSGDMAAAADQPSGTRTAVQKPGKRDLTTGSVTSTMLLFAVPMILGGSGERLYAYDIPDFYPHGHVHGRRRAVFYLLRAQGHP